MKTTDIFISCAAVADYKPAVVSETKIKKDESDHLKIHLEKNKDILGVISSKYPSVFHIGFAAETNDVDINAKAKLLSKKIDMIISNDVSNKLIGFDVDENEVNVITKTDSIFLKKDKKIRIAREILNIVSTKINKI
jgi:phosphopantothenoylcysteine decarboxylase/phosphopantothenate--cysteine ligase